MNANVDWSQLRDLFPIAGRIMERQALRIEALRKLKERSQEEDELLEDEILLYYDEEEEGLLDDEDEEV